MKQIVARWESRSGKHWAELYEDQYGFGYSGEDCSGYLGKCTKENALEYLQQKVNAGYFQPDANTTPMRRVV